MVILTKDESLHIARAIDSVAPVASDIFLVDSFSTDQTASIARDRGATVLTHTFVNQALQFNWALDHCDIKTDWVLRLDADEVIEDDLQEEIRRELPKLPAGVVGVNLKRKHIFMGRWVRHGGRYPLVMTRIFRTGKGRSEDRWMDEHIVVTGGKTVTFNGGFLDNNLKDIGSFIEKHNKYATREAIEVIGRRRALLGRDNPAYVSGSWNAEVKRFVKDKLYNRIPFTVSSTLYFLYRYLLLLGFLDGRSGLVYHFLQGYWYRFLVGAKIMEIEREISGLATKKEMIVEIERVTGHRLQISDGALKE